MTTITRQELVSFLNQYLEIDRFDDYGPNGLQVEGAESINRIAYAVSATQASITQAVKLNAQALIVHHGLFWKFHGVRTLTGAFGKRVSPLMKNNMNLLGYHLPLDAHPIVGNAATVAKKLGLEELEPFGPYKGSFTGIKGRLAKPISSTELKQRLEINLNHGVLHAKPEEHHDQLQTLGIITGGANSGWLHAQDAGLDAYLTGEMSEHDWHEAKEGGVHMFAAGHHATERFGIQALQQLISEKYGLEGYFIDSENPA